MRRATPPPPGVGAERGGGTRAYANRRVPEQPPALRGQPTAPGDARFAAERRGRRARWLRSGLPHSRPRARALVAGGGRDASRSPSRPVWSSRADGRRTLLQVRELPSRRSQVHCWKDVLQAAALISACTGLFTRDASCTMRVVQILGVDVVLRDGGTPSCRAASAVECTLSG